MLKNTLGLSLYSSELSIDTEISVYENLDKERKKRDKVKKEQSI